MTTTAMSERQLQFRVGVFVLVALGVASVLVFQFSDMSLLWEETYPLAIHFDHAPGLMEGAPVEQNGLSIGSVRKVVFDEDQGGVLAIVDIRERHRLRIDSTPQLVRSLFGDTTINFVPGRSDQFIPPHRRLKGEVAPDVNEIVQKLEANLTVTMQSFEETSAEWRRVGQNLNHLMESQEGNLQAVVDRAAVALDRLTTTMETANLALSNANRLVSDPQLQQHLRETVAALPAMVDETRQTILVARGAISKMEESLDHLARATDPLAAQSHLIVDRLNGSLYQLEGMLTEMHHLAQLINSGDGSLHRFATDPDLYDHLNRSAVSMALLLQNLEPIMADMRIFSDRVARHPELLGVSGALRGSSGIKDPVEPAPQPGSTSLWGLGERSAPEWMEGSGRTSPVLPAGGLQPAP